MGLELAIHHGLAIFTWLLTYRNPARLVGLELAIFRQRIMMKLYFSVE